MKANPVLPPECCHQQTIGSISTEVSVYLHQSLVPVNNIQIAGKRLGWITDGKTIITLAWSPLWQRLV